MIYRAILLVVLDSKPYILTLNVKSAVEDMIFNPNLFNYIRFH